MECKMFPSFKSGNCRIDPLVNLFLMLKLLSNIFTNHNISFAGGLFWSY